jgi:hypothetical protein
MKKLFFLFIITTSKTPLVTFRIKGLTTSFLFLIILSCCNLSAQTNLSPIPEDWRTLGTNSFQTEVSYRIIRCNSNNQIHLSTNNRSSLVQTLVCDLTIKNKATGLFITKQLIHLIPKNSITRASCSEELDLNKLKIDLPGNYDPNNLVVTIMFR